MDPNGRMRLVNTILEDVIVFLSDGPRSSSALSELLVKARTGVSGTTLPRALHSLELHGLIVLGDGEAEDMVKARKNTATAQDLIRRVASGEDIAGLSAPIPVPSCYRLTAKGQVFAAIIRGRRKMEARSKVPATLWGEFSRSVYRAVMAMGKDHPQMAPTRTRAVKSGRKQQLSGCH